jgi:hypothetical protein
LDPRIFSRGVHLCEIFLFYFRRSSIVTSGTCLISGR